MFKVGDEVRCSLRQLVFKVTSILDLGEGIRLLGRVDEHGDQRWIREEICQANKPVELALGVKGA